MENDCLFTLFVCHFDLSITKINKAYKNKNKNRNKMKTVYWQIKKHWFDVCWVNMHIFSYPEHLLLMSSILGNDWAHLTLLMQPVRPNSEKFVNTILWHMPLYTMYFVHTETNKKWFYLRFSDICEGGWVANGKIKQKEGEKKFIKLKVAKAFWFLVFWFIFPLSYF